MPESTPNPRPRCAGPDCPREAVRQGLCQGHYEQRRRAPDRPLRALRGPRGALGDERLARLSLRVPPRVLARLGEPPGVRARTVLEAWADGVPLPGRTA